MKLKNRLSLYAVIIFSIITLVISSVVYLLFYRQMERKEYQTLENKTLLAAIYYLEKDELPILEHENIKSKLQKTISRTDIIVYDANGKQFSGAMQRDNEITPVLIQNVREQNSSFFSTKRFFYHGIFYHDNQGDFVVFARESKQTFSILMNDLLHILLGVSLLGIVFIYLFSRYLANIAYDPLVKIIGQIKDRDTKNFTEPLILEKTYTEISDLIHTYNHFVDRIAQTFSIQKNFIDYVSHELRTPIAALMGTIEVTKNKKRSVAEYEEMVVMLQQYTTELQQTLDHMMLLSGARTTIEFKTIRIDEILWQVIETAVTFYQAVIDVDIQVEDTHRLIHSGNEKLLILAMGNILENAIKYSNNQPISIMLTTRDNRLCLSIQDKGIGIELEDIKKVTQNFYRGKNTQNHQGKGIGLSLADVIFRLHHIQMNIQSDRIGTTVILSF